MIRKGKYFFMREVASEPIGGGDVVQQDALVALRDVNDCAFQAIITSAPYFHQVDYGIEGQCGQEDTSQQYVDYQTEVAKEMLRVVKKDGILWYVIRDSSNASGGTGGDFAKRENGKLRYPAFRTRGARDPQYPDHTPLLIPQRIIVAFSQVGWLPISDIIWNKKDTRRGSARKLSYSYEHILLFAKSHDYYWDRGAVLAEYSTKSTGQLRTSYHGRAKGEPEKKGKENPSDVKRKIIESMKEKPGAYLTDVWEFFPGPQPRVTLPDGELVEGIASFPLIIPEVCINLSSQEGDWIGDPFMGFATTGVAAQAWGRNFWGNDLHPTYVRVAKHLLQKKGGRRG